MHASIQTSQIPNQACTRLDNVHRKTLVHTKAHARAHAHIHALKIHNVQKNSWPLLFSELWMRPPKIQISAGPKTLNFQKNIFLINEAFLDMPGAAAPGPLLQKIVFLNFANLF